MEEVTFPNRLMRAETVLSKRTRSLAVVFERPNDCLNINAVIRSLDGFFLIETKNRHKI